MATAKFKTQKEKGRFLHRSIHNGHFNKSYSFSSHAQTTIKHFQPLLKSHGRWLFLNAYEIQVFFPSITHPPSLMRCSLAQLPGYCL